MLATEISVQVTSGDLMALLPVMLLAGGGVLLLLIDAFCAPRVPGTWITPLLLCAAAWFQVPLVESTGGPYFSGMYHAEGMIARFHLLFLGIALLTWAISLRYRREDRPFRSEYHALTLFAASGMMLMAGAGHFLTAFLGLEILSLSLYALTAWRRERRVSIEAALKYFLLGTFAAAILLYGAALTFTASPDLLYFGLAEVKALAGPEGNLAQVGLLLIFAALLFKVSAAPFHMWTPDVYQGAPTPVTALMSTGTKAAGFALIIVLMTRLAPETFGLFVAAAILTMIVGNAGALMQQNLKRLLAYSSIAHAGTMLVGVAAAIDKSAEAMNIASTLYFYLVAYAITNLLAFGVIGHIETRLGKELTLQNLGGLASRFPLACAGLALAMLSLAGVPPTAGFFAKYYLFAAVLQADLLALALVAVLLTVISLGYYLKVIASVYMDDPAADGGTAAGEAIPAEPELTFGAERVFETGSLLLGAAAVLALGLFPTFL